ncbi:ribonuclease HI [Mesosutterella sp. OilRF-GAM-744-9]|uniref:Ribonuclease H n=1 Tax=Mesosutterella porci TaxID=2915351 RepID=A0ABS9MSP0_9BURK|nr:ribonuclease HI [Mesosutterella sp. oilRF-744-WT-GAM-9]MCG5031646.1 ribonuclease HI [Mesosutterella sp. oilRF-744-WT-GAM-9]MCI6530689.1 ribonuclease HI [Mesosutterella sp.]
MPGIGTGELEIWSDGACKGNPGPGGWGARLIYGRHMLDLYGGEPVTTNNRMELAAVIAALSSLKRPCPIVIHTDSQYVKNGISEWLPAWKARGWKTAGRKPVKNEAYWKKLDALVQRFDIRWQWVKGHAGVENNEAADRLANWGVEAAQGRRPRCDKVSAELASLLKSLGE